MFILEGMQAFANWLWGIPMLLWVVGGGFIMSIRLGFPQFTRLGFILKNTIGKSFGEKGEDGKFSGWQAVTGALASTLGAGNIIGTAMAVAFGGPGGVFWLWLSGFFCCVIKFCETTMAMKYRRMGDNGVWEGGPQIYLTKGTGWKWISPVYAVLCIFCLFLAASAQIGSGVDNLVVIAMNVGNLPGALAAVFADDFTGHAAVGGFVGATVTQSIRWGIARGCYSNDAGTGVTTIVHAVADVNHPIQQSMWAVFEVFFDTIIVCSMTCLVVLTSGVWTLKLDPAIMTATAFEQSLGSFGGLLVTIAVVLFTFTTACAQIEFTEAQFIALVGEKARGVARWIMLVLILGGGMVGISKLITYVDFFAGVYVLVNMLGVYWCNGQIVELFKEYFSNPQRWETEKWAPWVKMEKEYAARKGLNK